jgi:preprotein translocase subunit SecF
VFDIIGKKFWFFLASGVVVLASIVSLATFGLKPGVEFSSGSLMMVGFSQKVDQDMVKQELAALGYKNILIQHTGEGDFLLRLPELSGGAKTELESQLSARFGALEVKEFNTVSPMVAAETIQNAAIAAGASTIGILLYVAWAFRKMPNPFRYSVCAIIALIHDVLIALGTFSILGGILGWQIDLMFVIGILTVIGYSINDTVVIFDRIRENLLKDRGSDFKRVVNNSLVETLGRSLNTSLTTLFVAVALLLFIGKSIQNLAVPLLVGITVGTYSSICIAAPLLVVWGSKERG